MEVLTVIATALAFAGGEAAKTVVSGVVKELTVRPKNSSPASILRSI
jgi:hypothetical protein